MVFFVYFLSLWYKTDLRTVDVMKLNYKSFVDEQKMPLTHVHIEELLFCWLVVFRLAVE